MRNKEISTQIEDISYKMDLNLESELDYKKLKELEDELKEKNRIAEIYFIKGCRDIINNNTEIAKKNLETGKTYFSNTDYDLVKVYISKLLTEIYIDSKEYHKAINVVNECLSYIDEKSYKKNHKEIWTLIKLIVEIPDGREEAISILNNVLDNHINLTDKVKLNITRKLKGLYLTSDNYAKASESIIKTIYLARELEEDYIKAESLVEMGVLFNRLGEEHYAIEIINRALKEKLNNINDEVFIKIYGYLNLAETYLKIGNYEKAKEYSVEIEKYNIYFKEDDFNDIYILKNIIDAEIYINEENMDKAKDCLEEATNLLKTNESTLFMDENSTYYIASAKLNYANGDYNRAIEILELAFKDAIEKKDINNRKKIIEIIIKMSKAEGDLKLEEKYLNYLSQWHIENEASIYRDYTYYIIESVENNNILEKEKEKKVIAYRLLIIGVIIFYISARFIYVKIKRMKYISFHDGLTGVYNRTQFDKDYKLLLSKNTNFAVIIIDVDNFKYINDNYGHSFGDLVLINMCRVIKNILYDDCNVYRYGGEEFVILVKYKMKPEVIILAENIRKSIAKIVWENGLNTTISIGVANSECEKEDLLEKADENLYKAKKDGKNRTVFTL